ncbi:hypothetical protein CAEBREN_10981 [Caenorhabditis brenneri]|uniref:ShKT domain-containing protein n=1 Tax=Caenorhabditis brenneri TaxID=135651 RepID=G0P6L9_CAEBE|nr:hypothetical protein CAEBREN_10981 [Caenorhabditis brenneri]
MLKTLIFAVFLGYCTYVVYSQTPCMDNLINCPEEASHCNDYFYQQSCPLTCKVCKNPPDGCFDTNTECAISITACMLPQIYSQCNSTCGRCNGPNCVDHLSECPMYSKPCSPAVSACPTWAKNGFCTNTFYPPEQRKQYCAKTCKFC